MTAEARQMAVSRYVAEPTISNRNVVVSAHRYLCRRGARKFYRGTVDRADLEQIAAIGLIKASDRYSHSYQTPFEAYAWLMIVGELMHFVRDHERAIRIPRGLRAADGRYSEAYELLSARLEREPTPSELAAEMGVGIDVVDELRALRTKVQGEREREEQHSEFVQIPACMNEAYSIEDRLALGWALRHLSDRELRIVRAIFLEERTQAEIGADLGLSQRQVSRVLARTLERLARLMVA